MPEQLALDQFRRQRRAVDGQEWPARRSGAAAHLAGHQLLARAALAHDQHGARHRRDPGDLLLELRHGGARPHERRLGAQIALQRRHLSGQPLALQHALDLAHHALHRFGLVDEALRAEANRLDAAVVVAGAGVDDDRHLEAAALQGAQHLEAIHAGHLEVEDEAIDRLTLEEVERVTPAGGNERLVATSRVVMGRKRRGQAERRRG